MDAPMELSACDSPFSSETNGLHYLWGGATMVGAIGIYNVQTEAWSLHPTIGPTPSGLWDGGCAIVMDRLYCFGGWGGSSQINDLHELDLQTFRWSKIPLRKEWPICKAGCGFVPIDETRLVCFGGYGYGLTQPGSTFTGSIKKSGLTNELHIFDIHKGVWTSPRVKGTRPPPCSRFTFTKVDEYRAILFGGSQPDRVGDRVNDLYIFNLRDIEVTKVDPVHGDPWPEEREFHASCCLNYGDKHPKLLLSGGIAKGWEVLKDMWIFDCNKYQWTEVIPSDPFEPRCGHSTTASSLGPGLTEVLVFGGRLKLGGDTVSRTTLLRFEFSTAGPTPYRGKWALVDVAHNNTRASNKRLREKREKIRQATHEQQLFSKNSEDD